MKNYKHIFLMIILVLITAGGVKAGDAPSNDSFAAAMPLVISDGTASITI